MKKTFILLLLISCLVANAQEIEKQRINFKDWKIKPIFAFQGWGTYTMGQEEFVDGQFYPVDNRLNFMVRRMRWGTTATIGDRLFIKFLGAVDFLGSDQRAGTVGGVNTAGFPPAQIWDLYARYKISPNSEGLYVITGWLRPPLSRESMSGAMGVSSFEKGFNQWYIRQHLVGTGPGGTGGVYLGGMQSLSEGLHLDYRSGVFNPEGSGISSGATTSPLFVSRFNLQFGDPEKTKWTYGLAAANSFGKRQGGSLALVLSSEGPTTRAPEGVSHLGLDGIVSLGQWHAEGEWHNMVRKLNGNKLSSQTYMLRTGINIDVTPAGAGSRRYLEPSVMIYGFNGATSAEDFLIAQGTGYFGGEEIVFDVGLNYHLSPGKIRMGLHYTGFSGELGELEPSTNLSWYHFQSGIGPIRRGNYLGAEVIFSL